MNGERDLLKRDRDHSIGYYPGCALRGSSHEYDVSVRAVARLMGMELLELDDWSCCGASAAHCTNRKLAVCLSLRNMALAEEQGFDTIMSPCPLCSGQLAAAAEALAGDPGLKAQAEAAVGSPRGQGVRAVNYLQYIREHCFDAVRDMVRRPLTGLKVACYYGCLLTRPPRLVKFDDADQPTSMEEIVRVLGAEPADFPHRTECCGSGFTQSNSKAVVRLCRPIIESAKAAGAHAICVACPMCQMNLDMRQRDVEREAGTKLDLPVVYLSQLIGLALGIDRKELGLTRHFVSTVRVKGA